MRFCLNGIDMSVYRHPSRGDGWWMIKIYRPGGAAEYVPYQGGRDEALAFERELRGLADTTDPAWPDRLPEFMLAYRNRSRPRGYEVVQNSMRHLTAFFGGHKLRHIGPQLVEGYKAARLAAGVKPRTVDIELTALSAYLSWHNDTYRTDFPRPRRFGKRLTAPPLPRPLDMAEIAAVLRALDGDLRVIVMLMALCGLRKSEALNLTAADVSLSSRSLSILGKGGRERVVPYGDFLAPALEAACASHPSGPLFPSPRKPGRPRRDIYRAISRAARAAGIERKVNPHLFRHSFATILVNAGENLRTVQELLGHSELATTQIYTHVAALTKRRAADNLSAMAANMFAKK